MDRVEDRAELEAGARLTIDLAAIAANWRLMADHAAPADCAAVVKADAYGLGIAPVAGALWTAGARTFFVALLSEARALRAVLPEAVIYVLGGPAPGSAPLYRDLQVRPVLNSLAEIAEWSAFVTDDTSGAAAIHVDTGMNRLGISPAEAEGIAARLDAGTLGFDISLVMSHLACADEPGHPLTDRQIEIFGRVAQLFPGVPASLANSAGTLAYPAARFDLCRTGIALYGGNPLNGRANPLRQVACLEARVVQIREVPEGASVGYGAAQTLQRPSSLAILAVGYADGFLRAAGSSDARGGAHAVIAGTRCPLVGRVSMDLIAVDITDVAGGAVARGDLAALLGHGISVDDVAVQAGTISYEILTSLGSRYSRRYTR